MGFDELLEAVEKSASATQKEFEEKVKRRDEEFDDTSRKHAVSSECLEKSYNL